VREPAPPGPPALAPLREVIARHGLTARRSLGQNFLLDLNITHRIARAAGPLEGLTVIEVGPGPGGLTRALLASPARSVVAVERDARCIAALAELAAAFPGRLHVIEGDALEIDWAEVAAAPRAIVANLPYNIATPLLIGWLKRIELFAGITAMFQKEVAQRIVAAPGSPSYGRLSVMAGWRARPRLLFTLPSRAFTPPPKVESAVVRLEPRPAREDVSWEAMELATATAFGQRRKMLRAALRRLGDCEALLATAGIDPTLRAEDVDIAGFVRLARALAAR
jgi:16S rRNA (adenine1518-N6/adenine1519-N6)-dimethyltransferase